jgi:hypothetical protein
MSNHVHEVFSILEGRYFSNHMRRHHSRYGSYFNRKNNRCGKVAQDRPRTCLIEDRQHEMLVTFYIHANPIRAGMVKDMREYYFSTHRLYAFGRRELWMRNVVLPQWYLRLGRNQEQRQRRYRVLFARYLRVDGLVKRKCYLVKFIGNSGWVEHHEKRVSAWVKAHAPPE